MKSWKLAIVGLCVAVIGGFIGRWSGSSGQQSFAQEAAQTAAKPQEDSTEPDRGWIGLMVEAGTEGGLRVVDIFPGGPSAFGGIRHGDILLEVAAGKVQSEDEFAKAIENLKPGQEVAVVVHRDKAKHSLKVEAGSLREFHEHYAREMWSRDPRHPGFGKSHGVSHADVSVEMFRRLFEQNERIERSLLEMRKELDALRLELKGK